MRRALLATAGTVVGIAALLSYKSSGAVKPSQVTVAGQSPTPAAPLAPPVAPSAPTTSPAPTAATHLTGEDVSYRYGDIQLRVTVSGGRITDISVPQESAPGQRSQSINSQAIPVLTREALAAQGLQFDVVSGATFTSDAFAQALQSALAREGG